MSEHKNIKRNKTRPKAKDKGMYCGMQRSYYVKVGDKVDRNQLKLI